MILGQRLSSLCSSLRWPFRAARSVVASLRRVEACAAAGALLELRRESLARNPLLAYGAKYYSQHDEDGIIEEIARRALETRTGTFLELGVGDGLENNTLNLLANGWRGVWLGGESLAFADTGSRLSFRQCWIDRENVSALVQDALRAREIQQLDLLSLDLDGNDHALCKQLLDSALRPAIWIVEYNARFSPGSRWVMPYNAEHKWDRTDYFGASLAAFHELLNSAGYRLVACNLTGVNAFFVRADLAERFPEVPTDWHRLYMPATYLTYPSFFHPLNIRTVECLLK